ncbi:hypothetical protein R1sor_016315 [Riccia sorocarpa]|uniref:F-box domain-containing protein n=1 Tax=Riccia sorocarpa TaxID=122646 RepID=A0ABD3HGN7_9MARC
METDRFVQMCITLYGKIQRMSVAQIVVFGNWWCLLCIWRVAVILVDLAVERFRADAGHDDEGNASGLSCDQGSNSTMSPVGTDGISSTSVGTLIPHVPDDVVMSVVWPSISSVERPDPRMLCRLRDISRSWRDFISNTPEWLALHITRRTERATHPDDIENQETPLQLVFGMHPEENTKLAIKD